MAGPCLFCRIASRESDAAVVYDDEYTVAFLDHRPVFPGHVLLIPRTHVETLGDLPDSLLEPFFRRGRMLARGVEQALAADGSFVAINNRVSQSVPHLHLHVVPRRRKDGLRGFFWPRQSYSTPDEMERTRVLIASAIDGLK